PTSSSTGLIGRPLSPIHRLTPVSASTRRALLPVGRADMEAFQGTTSSHDRWLDVRSRVVHRERSSDFDLEHLVALCRWCHDQTDAPYERGRLVVTALGAGQFTFEVIARVRPNSPPAGNAAFAHVGKNSTLQR